MDVLGLSVLLAAGHYLADFPLQTEIQAANKRLFGVESIGFHTLVSHAAVHGLVAAFVATWQGYDWVLPFAAIGVSHFMIDFGKSSVLWPDRIRITQGAKWSGEPQARGLYGINVDQALHMAVIIGVALAAVA